jgi:DNA modification methylase
MEPMVNTVIQGDCTQVLQSLDAGNVGFILTDPPYLVNHRDRVRKMCACNTAHRASR